LSTTRLPGRASAAALAEPHHDGSELYVVERPEELGGTAVLRMRARTGAADKVLLRFVSDGEPKVVEAVVDEEAHGETWWRAELDAVNPVTRYRWLLAGGETGYSWLTGRGVFAYEVSGGGDFALTVAPAAPAWHEESVVYEIFPDRFASSGAERTPPDWAVPREWDSLPEGRSRNTAFEWFGGDLPGIEQHLDHVESLGANVLYLTPFFPADSTHRYDASTFDRVDPLLGGDEALRSLVRAAGARGM
jgi:alpha-glucosidase